MQRVIGSWRTDPAIEVLGNLTADRLPIVSFLIRPEGRRYLHHSFVVAVLSDLFGIQCRGGCSCAGPYGHRLLRIDDDRARDFAAEAVDGWLGIKPGWIRVSLAYYMSDAAVDFIIEAVHLIAASGARLLPEYRFDPRSGRWSHRDEPPPPASLDRIRYDAVGYHHAAPGQPVSDDALVEYLDDARMIFAARPDFDERTEEPLIRDGLERLRWFELPDVAATEAPSDTSGASVDARHPSGRWPPNNSGRR